VHLIEPETRLDEHLPQLADGIVARAQIEPPDLKSKLLPPQLSVVKRLVGLHSYSARKRNGPYQIVVGSSLYPMVQAYARAAATYFLPVTPGGKRPSALWPAARQVLASELEWLAAPAPASNEPAVEASPYQAQCSRAITAYTYRFLLCHEMSHIILGHVDSGTMQQGILPEEDLEVLRVSQEQELAADGMGLKLQASSLPYATQLEPALAGAVYFIHVTGLLDARLMMLAPMVDERAWRIKYTHPPAIGRVFNLMSAAEGIRKGLGPGLQRLHGDLCTFDGELFEAANRQQDKTASLVRKLVNKVVAVCRTFDRPENAVRDGSLYSQPSPAFADAKVQLLKHLNRSPIGVLKALEPEESTKANARAVRELVVAQFASALPEEFQCFRRQSPVARAAELA
jgi:hypothetical protein